ncbi:hypothetical protein [Phenylobacterium sp.]|uniref:hypothetical protein n=1 Tax=Phenylobacterium sp. TaxID=1871053 RepID=UPI0025DEE6D5|nr:hypothetical protein [Phenylobacterium sp.]
MAATKRKVEEDPVVEKLLDGTYDRQLAEFEANMTAAAAELRRAHAAMRAENTLRS